MGVLVLHAGQFDFQPEAPRQFCGLVAQRSAPSQRRVQINSAIFDETDYVRARRWLRNPRPQHTKQNPADARNKGSLTESHTVQQKDSDNNEESGGKKAGGKTKMRSGQPCDRRAKTESDTAGKGRGHRHGRQFHGARLNRTSVSMWYVCGKRSKRCISTIS